MIDIETRRNMVISQINDPECGRLVEIKVEAIKFNMDLYMISKTPSLFPVWALSRSWLEWQLILCSTMKGGLWESFRVRISLISWRILREGGRGGDSRSSVCPTASKRWTALIRMWCLVVSFLGVPLSLTICGWKYPSSMKDRVITWTRLPKREVMWTSSEFKGDSQKPINYVGNIK